MNVRRARAIVGDDVFDNSARHAALTEMSRPAAYVAGIPRSSNVNSKVYSRSETIALQARAATSMTKMAAF
jgi:hypothetical protein